MNYELAKELKDAGFQQHFPWLCGCDGPKYCSIHSVIGEPYSPTLEELIEACDALVEDCVYLSGHREQWSAVDGQDGFGIYGGDGKTPLEAVARLWLALQAAPAAPNTPPIE